MFGILLKYPIIYYVILNKIYKIDAYVSKHIFKKHTCKTLECDKCPCMICYEKVDNVIELSCKHEIHYSCWLKWVEKFIDEPTCPLCRNIHI